MARAAAQPSKRGRVCKRGRRTGAVNRTRRINIVRAGAPRVVAQERVHHESPSRSAICGGPARNIIETPFGHERGFRCEKVEDAAWVNEINALLTTAPCSPGFRQGRAYSSAAWRRRLRNFLFYERLGSFS